MVTGIKFKSVCMIVIQSLFCQFCDWCELSVTVCTHFVLCGGGVVYDIVIAGIAQPNSWDEASSSSDRDKKESGTSSHPTSASHSPTPPPQRRLAKSFSVAPSAVTKGNYGFLLLASVQLIFWLFLDCLCLFQLPMHFFFLYFYSVFFRIVFCKCSIYCSQ